MIINHIKLNITDDNTNIDVTVFGDGSVHFDTPNGGGGVAFSLSTLSLIATTVDVVLDNQDDGDEDVDSSSEDAYDSIDGEDTGVPEYPADNRGNTNDLSVGSNGCYPDSFYR